MSSSQETQARLLTSIEETRAAVVAAKSAGATIGFVPTMGALHQGHLSLVEASLAECDHTVVSIFVNPTQFAPHEDLEKYPRTLEEDLKLLNDLGCWLVFAPTTDEMYADDAETMIDVGSVAKPFEGASRPTHFQGVATVVLKLFQIVPADRAYFGRKDYQQSLVVKQMVRDLCVPTEICVQPTVRDQDGLALSSRNAYLNPAEREQACALWKSLQLADELCSGGETSAAEIVRQMKNLLATHEGVDLEYLAIVEEGTLHEVEQIEGSAVVILAAKVGKTRLIDNHIIGNH